ncbi:4Fe-4S dicluster domain-containing protein [Desulfoluna spongiiphila]|nr:4Fe-4S dicluster domain-containing protein [Desulfoluna spongiiphila]VVS94990.1 alpha-helical ferredoxin [Desulfoluna spongiiphila]
MSEKPVKLTGGSKSPFKDMVMKLLPKGGNLNSCLTCGVCASGCPATGLDDMDPRKFLRMAALGMDEEIKKSRWPWFCTMCMRCVHACPMEINIPQLVFNARRLRPREEMPKGILGSCDMALAKPTNSAMGCTQEDFAFVVEDILDEIKEEYPIWEERNLQAPIDKKGAEYFINQNSREPMIEPEEMGPLWKILNLAGVDWTYGSTGWAAENYCMFMADDEGWKELTARSAMQCEELGCKTFLNTE